MCSSGSASWPSNRGCRSRGFIGVADWFRLAYQTEGAKVVIDFYGTADGTGR